jgi:S-adenosyl methyltransferase
MKSAPGGVVGYVDADVREPSAIVASAKDTLDFEQPVAIMLLFTLAYVSDGTEAAEVVSALAGSVPSGSYVAIYHLASDLDPAMEEAARMWNKMMPTQSIALRSKAEVADLTGSLTPVPPGLVPVTEWRPTADPRLDPAVPAPVPVYGIVARKP